MLPSGLMRRNQRGAGPAKEVKNNAVPSRHIFDRIDDHRHRFDGGMERKLVKSTRLDAAIFPDVGTVAPVLAKLETVDVWGRAVLEGENQFVPGAIEGSHAAVALRPNDQVLELRVVRRTGFKHLAHVPPMPLVP
jgi:hypothetical protein